MCVYGDPGHGKTVAVHQTLRLLPRRIAVHRALVAVKPALAQLRAALLTAFGLPATSLTNRTDTADRALFDAFQAPGVLVIDDVQRIAAPEPDCLRLLVDAPHHLDFSRAVLCGSGAERTLARAPALASRVLTWQQVPRLDGSQVPTVLRLLHPLWDSVMWTPTCCMRTPPAHGGISVRGRRSPRMCTRLLPAALPPQWTARRIGPWPCPRRSPSASPVHAGRGIDSRAAAGAAARPAPLYRAPLCPAHADRRQLLDAFG
ncbi:hypothetical protein GCM10020000_84980 [Streptomyces olivoverticillatus]